METSSFLVGLYSPPIAPSGRLGKSHSRLFWKCDQTITSETIIDVKRHPKLENLNVWDPVQRTSVSNAQAAEMESTEHFGDPAINNARITGQKQSYYNNDCVNFSLDLNAGSQFKRSCDV